MTSIVKDRPSDVFFDSFERFAIAKETGALTGDEFSKIQILLGSIFSNQVKRGLKTEEETEDFINEIPNGNWPCFNYPHTDLEVAHRTINQDISAALYERENIVRKAQPVKRL